MIASSFNYNPVNQHNKGKAASVHRQGHISGFIGPFIVYRDI